MISISIDYLGPTWPVVLLVGNTLVNEHYYFRLAHFTLIYSVYFFK